MKRGTLADELAKTPRRRWDSPVDRLLTGTPVATNDPSFWIIRDAVARGVASMWAGPPNGGKSWGAMDLALCVAAHLPWLGTFENTLGAPGVVLYLALEDTIEHTQARAQALARGHGLTRDQAAAAERNLIVTRASLRLPDDETAFAEYIAERKPALVILDTLAKVMVGDENSTKDAGAFCDSLGRLCASTSILLLHHTSKDGFGKSSDAKVRGSSALVGHMRHLLRSSPVRADVSAVAMSGNLAVARDRFELGFEQHASDLGGATVRLVDLTTAAAEVQRTRSAARSRSALTRDQRRDVALELAATSGHVTIDSYREQLGADAPSRSVCADDLTALVAAGLLEREARSGTGAAARITTAGRLRLMSGGAR